MGALIGLSTSGRVTHSIAHSRRLPAPVLLVFVGGYQAGYRFIHCVTSKCTFGIT